LAGEQLGRGAAHHAGDAGDRAGPGDRQGEAMRRSMLALLADDVSNPRMWAPFSLVGEGGR
jgi:hypothetical protein